MKTQFWIGGRLDPSLKSCSPNYVRRVDENGIQTSLPWKLEVSNHSPTGLSWGYWGSGPCQLALAIVSDFFGGDEVADRQCERDIGDERISVKSRQERAGAG